MDEEIEDVDADESDEEPDSFDSVCAICDNGGELLWYLFLTLCVCIISFDPSSIILIVCLVLK